MRQVYSIRFPLVKERTGTRRGRRYRMVPSMQGLDGEVAKAARMVHLAILSRDRELFTGVNDGLHHRMARLQMRCAALMARNFAGQIDSSDGRFDFITSAVERLRTAQESIV